MSALPVLKRRISQGELADRTRGVVTPLNLHWAGLGLLALVNLYLLLHMLFAWRAASSQDAAALANQRMLLTGAQIAARPLQGLDVKIERAGADADNFYKDRLPVSYSQVAAELGALAKDNKVKLTRVQYTQAPVLGDGSSEELTEVRMDASLSGDYRPLVLFINNVERDKRFFLITGVNLTGGQAGLVNLRVRLNTYIRGIGSEEEMKKVAIGGDEAPDAAPADATAKGGAR
ncbi:hypothetical protein SAMN05421770_10662 [Granulicella rosea]|uniref:Uncharacterized protein n=1 Tax=Granulicella rosea TaxID=474952 RepID=A0A239L2X0_9BACT|nr:hypothetical protein [Granulicella rosea]SNT24660.1 hypothetical protein SAMN05421770_10662 [Granulicella rosea]